ncbi:amino acid adenylation domain-containing protein [Nostoc sp. FACHB-87]|uniref:non-ribosomal peptide synthetase n=1 Tax=Nostocaceae TaxID=1162 RepID=UPI0016887C00|nr:MULTISPECIES: non-ribosomal peptide synthetase [Nostocaceae]MBD2455148.1 amino acid adenylation domain-containing protein [Nostoc sp. FACHB-87]MBD2477844.1 amino acid adenylation domain-containing protein [Anabaena sp. FACHB-83]
MEAKNIEDIYTLSPTQQGMLFHILSAPDGRMYVEQTVCTLHANLNISAFEQVWQQIIDRHQSLRTAFVLQGVNQPVQIVHRQVKLAIAQYDWRELSTTQQQAQLQSYLEVDQKSGFDLAQPPLMRLTLIQTDVDTYQFIWSICHLVVDAWCVNTILKEFLSCYEALCQGQILQLPPSRPYRDYISWLKQQDLSEAEVFWRKYLQGFTTPTALTTDGNNQQEGFHQQQVQLSPATTQALKSLAQQHHLTLNTLIQGVWALLLSYYNNEADVVYGTVVSGRPPTLLGVASMVGLFINTLPVRVFVSGEASLISWLKSLHAQQLSLLKYECTPLVQIQSWSQVPPGIPLFNSILVFENASANLANLPTKNLKIAQVRSFINSNYPLVLLVKPWSQLSLNIFYDLRYFNQMTVDRMLSHLEILLNNIVANPDTTLAKLTRSIVDIEQQKLLIEFNNTKIDNVNDKCIHQLIEEQVKRTPENIAVVFKNQQLTYKELNTRANQLAQYLQALGVAPDVLVGICIERSWEMLVGILAILKAGGGYVPIDPLYPQQRLNYILADSQVSIILTQERLVKNLPDIEAKVLCLDTLWDVITQESDENPQNQVKPENLAYLIYTSGSTGKPKGVQVTHQNLVHSTTARMRYYEQSITGFLLTSPFAFDSSVAGIFWTLCQGGFVFILPDNWQLNIQQIIEAIAQQEISHLLCLPSLYKLILEQAQPQKLLSLKTVIVAGESCPKELVKQHRELLPNVALFNEYGPTEATVWSSVYNCQNHDLNYSVPIGRPIANTQIYVLDAHLQPVSIGVAGEIYIGGLGVAKGYLNRPELTAQKFIPNPFSDQPNARLYKTGDLGRYLPDGNIEFLGRIDQQVKIRGYRIELPEIEAVLHQHPAVQQAIAIAPEDINTHRRLTAYIVPKQEQVPTIDDLRSFLKNYLPDYMLPSVFVMLKTLPLTPNGKVDRQALPIPDQARPNLEAVFVPPSTPIEVALAEIWSQVLSIEKVGIHDNFLKLGGDSLRSIQVLSRANNRGLNFSLQEFIQHPTIYELSQVIKTNQELQIPAIKPVSRDQYRLK